jgi:DNA-binding response OmpR family regulator
VRPGQRKNGDSNSKIRVLVAEDDDSIRRLLAVTLRRAGLTVDVARDGAEAVDFLGKRRYRALVSDLMMPKMSGWDVMRWLERHPSERPHSVIITTAADRSVLRDLNPNVVNAIFVKPFDPHNLSAYIKACCEHGASRDRRRRRVVADTFV